VWLQILDRSGGAWSCSLARQCLKVGYAAAADAGAVEPY
jgi:hypothetical protein